MTPLSTTRRPRRGALRRSVSVLLIAILVLAPIAAVLLAIETSPRVTDPGTPDATAAARVRDLAERLQPLVGSEAAEVSISASEDEMNAALASIARMRPGVAGRVTVGTRHLDVAVSAGAPLMPAGLWANLQATLTASERGLEITRVSIGRLPLPVVLVEPALRFGLDRALGDGTGAAMMRWIAGLRIDPPRVTLAVAPGEFTGGGQLERLKQRLRALATGTTQPRRVHVHLMALHRAAGSWEQAGENRSLVPYLAHSVAEAGMHAAADPQAEMRAAIFALALYCGDPRFGLAIGVAVPGSMTGADSHCAEARLAGRHDLVRHFVLSAGIHAASTDGAVLGLSELKELLDSNPGGSGFSFDDMAANLSGARLASLLMAAPPADWPALGAAIATEDDVLPPIDGLPAGLAAEAFRARYGDIDSPAYQALMAEIEARIDALPLYRHPPAD